jgi:hypothetical protein
VDGFLALCFLLVQDQLLFLADIEGEVVVLAPHWQVSSSVIRPTTVVSSENLMMVLESWVKREYRRGKKQIPLRGNRVEG